MGHSSDFAGSSGTFQIYFKYACKSLAPQQPGAPAGHSTTGRRRGGMLLGIAAIFLLVANVACAQSNKAARSASVELPSTPDHNLWDSDYHWNALLMGGVMLRRGTNRADSHDVITAQAAPLQRRLQANPRDTDALVRLGNLYYYQAFNAGKAIGYYEAAVKNGAGSAEVLDDLAACYAYTGDPDRAIKTFAQVLRENPSDPSALFDLGQVLFRQKHDFQAAIKTLQEFHKRNPDPKPDLNSNLTNLHQRADDVIAEAQDCLKNPSQASCGKT